MPIPVFERLRDYFQSIADSFEDNKSASTIFPNSVDSGSTREDIFLEFLKKHVPNRCDVIKGGFVFNHDGIESRQIDIIVTNDLTLNFKNFNQENGKSFSITDGVYCVFSIKSILNKEGLFDSLDNLHSVPQFTNIKINPALKNNQKSQRIPHRLIFGFDGIDVKKILTYLNEYYSTRKIPETQKIDFIVVNNKFIIQNSGHGGIILSDGTKIPPFQYFDYEGKFIGAWSLWVILTSIQTLANFGPHILFNFKNYDDNFARTML